MSRTVFGIADSEPRAERIVADLRDAGFPSSDISLLFPDRNGGREFRHDAHTKAPRAPRRELSTGGAPRRSARLAFRHRRGSRCPGSGR